MLYAGLLTMVASPADFGRRTTVKDNTGAVVKFEGLHGKRAALYIIITELHLSILTNPPRLYMLVCLPVYLPNHLYMCLHVCPPLYTSFCRSMFAHVYPLEAGKRIGRRLWLCSSLFTRPSVHLYDWLEG